ncbi:hypothetical protein E4U45_006525 [Claviceps purpurea]|nr:hypothetical protein E4U45_006525 [Claviceps purpurea]
MAGRKPQAAIGQRPNHSAILAYNRRSENFKAQSGRAHDRSFGRAENFNPNLYSTNMTNKVATPLDKIRPLNPPSGWVI